MGRQPHNVPLVCMANVLPIRTIWAIWLRPLNGFWTKAPQRTCRLYVRPSGRPVSVRCYISVTYGQIQFKIDVSICYQEGIDPMYNFFRCLLACWSYCPLLLKNNLFFPSDALSLKRIDRIQWNFVWIFVITGAWMLCIFFPDCLWHVGVIALCYSEITYMMLYLCYLWTDST